MCTVEPAVEGSGPGQLKLELPRTLSGEPGRSQCDFTSNLCHPVCDLFWLSL